MQTQSQYKRHFSCEFFPPKTSGGLEKLNQVQQQLAVLKPAFYSVTYGAGGSTRDRTLSAVEQLQGQSGIITAPHISCVGDTKAKLGELLDLYQNQGINRLVALRGDLPSGMAQSSGELKYACDLVQFIRQHSGDHFHIEVAAYPEMHPQADSFSQDLKAFKTKVDAGANSAITQYFFNPDAYGFFVDACEKFGIDLPIVPGIMPITKFENLVRFSAQCGADIPRWIRTRMESYSDEASNQQLAEEIVTQLCQRLLDMGAPGLHFYTLNQAAPTLAIWKNLRVSAED